MERRPWATSSAACSARAEAADRRSTPTSRPDRTTASTRTPAAATRPSTEETIMTTTFQSIDLLSLDTVHGGVLPGPVIAAGAKLAGAAGKLLGGQVNTNVQTGSGHTINQNTGSGNQTINNYNG